MGQSVVKQPCTRMKLYIFLCMTACLLSVVLSKPQGPPPIPYQFQYRVEDPQAPEGPVDFGQQEARDDQVTNGRYTVLLPDGRIQTVTYQVTPDSGFFAGVLYNFSAFV